MAKDYYFERVCPHCGKHYDAAGLDMMYLDYCPDCDSPVIRPKVVKTFGLIAGRHNLPVDECIFDNVIEDMFDFDSMDKIVARKIHGLDGVNLYATGFTPALLSVVKYCHKYKISLAVYHYDKTSGEYILQEVL